MKVKDSSVKVDFSAEAWSGLFKAEQILRKYVDDEQVITSGSEAISHSVRRSAHHRGDAWDVRRWYLDHRAAEYTAELQHVLGRNWVVLLESDHIHAHWSPVVF